MRALTEGVCLLPLTRGAAQIAAQGTRTWTEAVGRTEAAGCLVGVRRGVEGLMMVGLPSTGMAMVLLMSALMKGAPSLTEEQPWRAEVCSMLGDLMGAA